MNRFTLTLSCPDEYGIVAAVAGLLTEHHGFILQSGQFSDIDTNRFFMRLMFRLDDPNTDSLRKAFKKVAERYSMEWQLQSADYRPKVLLLVSKQGHCLNALLHEHHAGNLPVDIAAIGSNHRDLAEMAGWYKARFEYLPVTPETKSDQERQIANLCEQLRVDLVILARYMQILSPWLVERLYGHAINIHHSFLPSFKGAKPYHQAHARGVKLIGATAHYVSNDLDEGPIIEQEVQRVDHSLGPKQLVTVGRSIESAVLLRAVQLHIQQRIFLDGNKTVIFR